MKKIIIASIVGCVLLQAQVLPGINSKNGAMTLPRGKLKIGVKHISMKINTMYEGKLEVKNNENLDGTIGITLLALRFGVSKNSDIGIVLPFKKIYAKANLGPNSVVIDNKGVGDIIMMGRYVVLPMAKYGYQFSVGAGLKLPTGLSGATLKKAPANLKNAKTPLPTQAGTGKYEYKVEFGISNPLSKRKRIDINVMYTGRPIAKNQYDFGNEISYDFSYTKAFTNTINIGIEYNGKYNSETKMGADTTPLLREKLPFKAFSGTVGYITPEIEYVSLGKQKINIGLGISYLEYCNVRGYQVVPKMKYTLRAGYLF
jgi:hypothetical protein